MSDLHEVKCDACGADLTYTGNCEDYRLVLASQSKVPWFAEKGDQSGFVTSMAIPDPMPRPQHFCDHDCLRAWVNGDRKPAEPAAA